MSASLALKPGLSQRVYDWLVSLFSSEPDVRASQAPRRRSGVASGAMPVMGRSIPDYELAEVEIVRPSAKAGPALAWLGTAAAPAAEQHPVSFAATPALAVIEVSSPAVPTPRWAARMGAVATLNPPTRRTLALARTTAAVIKVERRKAVHRHDVATPRPVVIVKRAKRSGRPAKSLRSGR